MKQYPCVLDCDTGMDDAIAIAMATESNLPLLGITTVAGNVELDHVVVNTLHVLQHLDKHVPVYAGCSLPMVREQLTAKHIHGEKGLEGPQFAPLEKDYHVQSEHALFFLKRVCLAHEQVTLIATGPLTNYAMLLRLAPELKSHIHEIVLMGGSSGIGNVTPAAEFNIYADPEAAHVVFTSGVPVTMFGLDVTMQVLVEQTHLDRMRALGTLSGNLFADVMRAAMEKDARAFQTGVHLHDVTTIAYLLQPTLFTSKPSYTSIDLTHTESYGRTNCDFHHRTAHADNCQVVVGVDLEGFWNLVEETFR